ncbi:MAG: recombinase family protein [Chloroflexus sp.]|nr:recombinase family protein [Chloroflexus sp.]
MKAVVYARVSSEEQGNNFSIPSQIAACHRYATDRNWHIVAELTDTMSGAVLDRPGLRKLRDLIAVRAVDAVIVYSLDRLSRNVAHMLLLRDELYSANIELHAVTRGQSADTAEGRLFDTIESAFAEYERLKIKAQSMRGRRAKVQSGNVLGHGAIPPYGYRYVGHGRERTLEVDEIEAAWVRKIFTWSATGVSLRSVAARLDAAGVLPPGNTRHCPARHWSHATIRNILRNSVYIGTQYYPAFKMSVSVPALVDESLWREANARLDENKRNACQVVKRIYPLRGRVRCASCNGPCHGNRIGHRYAYYVCQSYDRQASRQCARKAYANAERLEAEVWQWVQEHVLDEERLITAIDQANASEAHQRAELERERAAFARQVAEVEQRIARLIEAFTTGVLSLDDFTAFKRRFDEQKAGAQQELARVDRMLADDAARRIDREGLLATARAVRASLTAGIMPEDQMRVYAALDVQVVTDGVTAHVTASLTGDVGVLSCQAWPLSRTIPRRHRVY